MFMIVYAGVERLTIWKSSRNWNYIAWL